MREIHSHTTTLGSIAVNNIKILELHATLHFGIGYMEQFQCLEYIIGEITIEAPGYLSPLMLAFAGETLSEIIGNDTPPIPYNII